MKLNIEPVAQTWHELNALLHDYFTRTQAKEGLPQLRMNWAAYTELNEAGGIVLLTARDGDKLIGFVMYHVFPHLHHMGVINAACDIIAVDVDARGQGIARALMAHAEPVLRNRGVQYITHQFRTCYDTEPLFPKLGYKLFEQGYLKELN